MPLALFILYILAEIFLLIRVGNEIGAFNLLLCLFASAVLGLWAIRANGREILARVQEDVAAGRPLHGSLMDGILLFCGGVLLIVPGFLSDALGLLLLIAPLRRSAGAGLERFTNETSEPRGKDLPHKSLPRNRSRWASPAVSEMFQTLIARDGRLNARPGGNFFFFSRTIGPLRREEDAKSAPPGRDIIIEGTAREVSRSDIPGRADDPGGPGRADDLGGPGRADDPGGPGRSDDLGGPGRSDDPGGPGRAGDPGGPGRASDPGGPGRADDPAGRERP
jgi:UPF0716 protein FxsA